MTEINMIITAGIGIEYDVISADTFAKAVKALREINAEPFTFKQNIEARVNSYNTEKKPDGSKKTEEQRLELFNLDIDSCTGIAYKKRSTKFKIIPECKELINIKPDFNKRYLPIDYEQIQGTEFDSRKNRCNEYLTPAEIIEHPAWLTTLENDKALLKEYARIYVKYAEEYEIGNTMGFMIKNKTYTEELRALSIFFGGDSIFSSHANGRFRLNAYTQFLRALPEIK